jgi:hypothetical protein
MNAFGWNPRLRTATKSLAGDAWWNGPVPAQDTVFLELSELCQTDQEIRELFQAARKGGGGGVDAPSACLASDSPTTPRTGTRSTRATPSACGAVSRPAVTSCQGQLWFSGYLSSHGQRWWITTPWWIRPTRRRWQDPGSDCRGHPAIWS